MDDLPPEQRFAFEIFERESKEGCIDILELPNILRMTNLVITGNSINDVTYVINICISCGSEIIVLTGTYHILI